MRFDESTIRYLRGTQFHGGLQVPTSASESLLLNRLDYLETLLRGKRVIHMGCADHHDIIDGKLSRGHWLHARLVDVCALCLGIDIDPKAVAHIRDDLGFSDVLRADIIQQDIPELHNQHWDTMLLGAVIEHVDNPIGFMTEIRKKYQDSIDELLITVPSAFRLTNFTAALRHREVVNTDHRFWYTPYTLAMNVIRAGMTPLDFCFVDSFPLELNWKGKIALAPRNWILTRYPSLRDTIVMRVSLDAPQ